MKKTLAIIFVLTIILGLPACKDSKLKNLEGKNTYEFEGIVAAIPNDFYVVEDSSPVTAYSDADNDSGLIDSVSFTLAGVDSLSNYDKDKITNLYSSNFSGFTGISRYETSKVGDNDIIIVTYGLQYEEFKTIQSQAWIFLDDKSIIITYTSMTGTYDEDFEFSIQNIALAE